MKAVNTCNNAKGCYFSCSFLCNFESYHPSDIWQSLVVLESCTHLQWGKGLVLVNIDWLARRVVQNHPINQTHKKYGLTTHSEHIFLQWSSQSNVYEYMTKWKTAITKLITPTKHRGYHDEESVGVFSASNARRWWIGSTNPLLATSTRQLNLGYFSLVFISCLAEKIFRICLEENISLPFYLLAVGLSIGIPNFFLSFLETTVSFKRDRMIDCCLPLSQSHTKNTPYKCTNQLKKCSLVVNGPNLSTA